MSLRAKLVVVVAALTAGATIAIGVVSYRSTASGLLAEVDRSIETSARFLQERADVTPGDLRGRRPGAPRVAIAGLESFDLVLVQVLSPDGVVLRSPVTVDFPVTETDRRVAGQAIATTTVNETVTVDGQRYRITTAGLGGGRGAMQVARSLEESDRLLAALRNRIVVAVLLVTAAAAGLGLLIAHRITRRLVRVTSAAEEVAETGRLDVAVPVDGNDEAGRLGHAFNEMLMSLARSKDDQQRLVQDAGHELRTPLTSLRTNVAVLRSYERLGPEDRARLLDDLDGETRELTDLVDELIDLATDRHNDEPAEDVVLADLAERVAERARRRTGRQVTVTTDASVVRGRPLVLERAASNLLDNAAKFDEQGTAPIEVTVQRGQLLVSDRGPGLDAGDLGRVFDRFYRAVGARSRPGSGLGLAIVRDVAEAHSGTVFAANRPGGGAVIGFTVPVISLPGSSSAATPLPAPRPHVAGGVTR